MQKNKFNHISAILICVAALGFTACKKDGNPNKLPTVNLANYNQALIETGGFTNSDEVYSRELIAYWSFDGGNKETLSGVEPTKTSNTTLADGGVRGKALSLNGGYLYYATQFSKFKTDSLKNWSLSAWVKIKNNGSKRTMVFQLARPTIFNGNINFALNTNGFPADNVSKLRLNPTFTTLGGGSQDNLNNVLDSVDLNQWVHIVLTYDSKIGTFHNWINGVKVGNYPNRGLGNSLFKSWEPSEVLIGANYNAAGMQVSTDVNFAPMTGQIDELRIYNAALPDGYIGILYKLGKAGK